APPPRARVPGSRSATPPASSRTCGGQRFDDRTPSPRDRLLPPAVPPDPGEQRVVGSRVHRVDQRRSRPALVPRSPAAAPPLRARVLRSATPGIARGAKRDRPSARHRGVLLLALLVRRRFAHPGAAV